MSYFSTKKKKITRIIRMKYNLYTEKEYKTIKECQISIHDIFVDKE